MNKLIDFIMIFLLVLLVSIFIASICMKDTNADYLELLEWGKYTQAVTIYDKQVDTLIELGYSKTRIIDLITLQSMECASYEGSCKNGTSDIGNFQINQIHEKEYKQSLKLWKKKKWAELYLYQAKYVNGLIDSYESGNCSQEAFDSIGRERTNEERFRCIAVMYNGSSKKRSYAKLALRKRESVRTYILNYIKGINGEIYPCKKEIFEKTYNKII